MGAAYDILVGTAIGVGIILLFNLIRYIFGGTHTWPKVPEPLKINVGTITEETLKTYCGYDITKPLLVAVRGKLYDVGKDRDTYGIGKPLHVYAGREIARALALGSTKAEDCTGDIDDLTKEQLQQLDTEEARFQSTYDKVGEIEPLQQMTAESLATFDGVVPDRPIYFSVKGKIYDVTTGRQFYGKDGVYPFAGKECARALALMSTDLADCNDNLEGLGVTELDTLNEWIAKFDFKYPVVGRLVKSSS